MSVQPIMDFQEFHQIFERAKSIPRTTLSASDYLQTLVSRKSLTPQYQWSLLNSAHDAPALDIFRLSGKLALISPSALANAREWNEEAVYRAYQGERRAPYLRSDQTGQPLLAEDLTKIVRASFGGYKLLLDYGDKSRVGYKPVLTNYQHTFEFDKIYTTATPVVLFEPTICTTVSVEPSISNYTDFHEIFQEAARLQRTTMHPLQFLDFQKKKHKVLEGHEIRYLYDQASDLPLLDIFTLGGMLASILPTYLYGVDKWDLKAVYETYMDVKKAPVIKFPHGEILRQREVCTVVRRAMHGYKHFLNLGCNTLTSYELQQIRSYGTLAVNACPIQVYNPALMRFPKPEKKENAKPEGSHLRLVQN